MYCSIKIAIFVSEIEKNIVIYGFDSYLDYVEFYLIDKQCGNFVFS